MQVSIPVDERNCSESVPRHRDPAVFGEAVLNVGIETMLRKEDGAGGKEAVERSDDGGRIERDESRDGRG